MKLYYYLVVATTLLSSCVDLFQPLRIGVAALAEADTFPRSLKTESRNGIVSEKKEERAGGNLDKVNDGVKTVASKLADEMDDILCLVKMFKHWKQITVKEIFRTPAVVELANRPNDEFMRIFNLYGEFNLLGKKSFIKKFKRMQK
ncbi:secreted RxLR effector peptide protein, putative [Phytophthora infestans T30-4]|uniref:Secreted RxLR effector peptide protein n=2 Tax=Phytophthora infestans TaxID=4787 RepID=A0A833T9S9_PHYIN